MTDLEDSFQREKLDHERETRFNRDIQLHEMELMQQISQIKTIMVGGGSARSPGRALIQVLAFYRTENLSSWCS